MGPYDWKKHWTASFTAIDSSDGFVQYHIKNNTGDGVITSCTVFPGVQAVACDESLAGSSNPVKPDESVIEINFCLDGRYECIVNRQYCFIVSAGDVSVGYVGRKEAGGRFPTGKYRGITIFLEMEVFTRHLLAALVDLRIDMEHIRSLACGTRRYIIPHQDHRLGGIRGALPDAFREKNIPLMKMKVLELLLFLSRQDADAGCPPVYLSRKNAALAESAQGLLASDLSRHIPIRELAAELGTGSTTLKKAFQSVYGLPIYQYHKELRLQEAQKLLRETDASISEIAAAVSYVNPAKFSSAFRQRFGVSPTEYRIQQCEGAH